MFARLRARLTYANVVATLALFLALGGVSYAAIRVGSASIVNNSVRTQDLRNNDIRSKDIRNRTIVGRDVLANTITGQQVRESSFSKVPDADSLDGQDSSAFKVGCPAGTQRHAGGCIETSARPPANFDTAARTCGTAGRRLPNVDELASFGQEPGIELANPGELTSVRLEASPSDTVETVDDGPTYFAGSPSIDRSYRCEAPLSD